MGKPEQSRNTIQTTNSVSSKTTEDFKGEFLQNIGNRRGALAPNHLQTVLSPDRSVKSPQPSAQTTGKRRRNEVFLDGARVDDYSLDHS